MQAKPSSHFLRRFTLPSDEHPFIGRIFDLSIVGMSFDSYDELARYPDCEFVYRVNDAVSTIAQQVNPSIGGGILLWPEPLPSDPYSLPISLFESL